MQQKKMVVVQLHFLAFMLAVLAAPVIADDLDDALGGFNETVVPATSIAVPESAADDSPYGDLTGSVSISASYNFRDHDSSNPSSTANRTDWQGLSKLRSRLNLEYNKSLKQDWQMHVSGYAFYDSVYELRGRDNYSDSVLDDYEHESEFQEVWVRGKINKNFDIKLGRQIVIWGRADSFRVLDVLNPLDNREPGIVDIEDLRLPVTMFKADYFYNSNWQSSFIVIPEVRFSKNPPMGSDFEVKGSNDFAENEPEHISDSSYAAAVTGIFSGWDISFHAARIWRDAPYLNPVFDPMLDPFKPLKQSTFEHSHVTLIGTGGNYTNGPWLYKAELAVLDGIDYTLHTDNGTPYGVVPTATTEKNRVDGLLGIEYFGIANTSLSIEVAHQYIPDFDDGMKPSNEEKNTTGLALRATHSMLNDRLDLTALVFGNFGEAGGGWRFDGEYDLMDALVLKGGVIFYEEGDEIPFNTYYKNDRLFAELKYSF